MTEQEINDLQPRDIVIRSRYTGNATQGTILHFQGWVKTLTRVCALFSSEKGEYMLETREELRTSKFAQVYPTWMSFATRVQEDANQTP